MGAGVPRGGPSAGGIGTSHVGAVAGAGGLVHLFGTGHSRIPVYQDSSDNIIGVLYVKDLLAIDGALQQV